MKAEQKFMREDEKRNHIRQQVIEKQKESLAEKAKLLEENRLNQKNQ